MDRFPLPGIEIYKNEKNRFIVFQIHYSANPRKTDPEYIASVKAGMPIRQFMQEYELQWDSFEGQPVYADWDKNLHGSKEDLCAEVGLPLFRGWDFGLTPACLIAQMQGDQLVILREITAINMGAQRFKELVVRECKQHYPAWHDQEKHWIDVVDPSGFFRKDTDENTCAKILSAAPNKIKPLPGQVTWEERRTAVEHFLTRHTKKGPCFKVDMAKCPILTRGFNGGYRYDEKAFDIEPNKPRPLKDEHSHIQDALQYICGHMIKMRKTKSKSIPTPVYSFSQK